ncbi:hypothetical protein GW915_06130 [bacterium]|nr:hypothetical protein [bacterium]
MATSSSHKIVENKRALGFIKELSLNTSLPIVFFNKQGKLIWANARMLSLLDLSELPSDPVQKEILEQIWPFSNDEKGPPAVLSFLLNKTTSIEAHANLKNFRLKSHQLKKESITVVSAELIRSGDLLQDKESRQLLFRVISHEVRTAVATLKGYADMISDDQSLVKDRMKFGIERLEKVVALLRDLKIELEIED